MLNDRILSRPRIPRVALLALGLAAGCAAALAARGAGTVVPEPVAAIFTRSCALSGCHMGRTPEMGMSLERDRIPASAVGVVSKERPAFKIVDPSSPATSYLVKKIRGDAAITGQRMPFGRTPLPEDDIRAIETWIASLPKSDGSPAAQANASGPTFWGMRLVNLPTDRMIDKGHFLFQVSHRFYPAVSTGRDTFFGLDGPGYILLGFGYGISDRLAVTLGRTNLLQEVALGISWLAAEQKDGGLPVSIAATAGAGLVTVSQSDRSLFAGRNMRASLQVSVTRKVTDRLSLMVVPGYTTNADPLGSTAQGTFGLGFGGRYMVLEGLSLIGEWSPIRSGFKAEAAGWGGGIEKKIGGHVFQFFVANSLGLTPGQYLPGGDLKKDVRLGFNIFRTF
jgi:hypothetical protein